MDTNETNMNYYRDKTNMCNVSKHVDVQDQRLMSMDIFEQERDIPFVKDKTNGCNFLKLATHISHDSRMKPIDF